MDISELIGFFITAFALLFVIFRGTIEKWRERGGSEADHKARKAREERLKDFLSSLNKEMSGEKPAPLPPKPKKIEKRALPLPRATEKEQSDQREERYSGSHVVSRHYKELEKSTPYEVIQKKKPSRASLLLRGLSSRSEIVILHDIIGRPKGYR